ncbi:hypothetical protein [Rhizobium sp. SSA_523]|uniref:hypothetical protein n=1 Tax=Rhizobium sp. SSA_523 TaxID=2952477 RepID=UPI002091D755|nr:hypothetical protein [Rhizobium sp. SSA_523]MCO5732611.1 hypothetical protein [Rhizobium sp. SSA_523]WKC23754.1 hypothetical protein QTJ18_23705 [Rhizobium sp. SSA_523]
MRLPEKVQSWLVEIRHPLRGLQLTAQGDARGLSHFDVSDEGIIRSFRAVLFSLPAFLVYAILRRIEFLQALPDLGRWHLTFIFQVLVIEASLWCFTILSLILSGMALGLRPLIRPMIVMANWGAIPFVYAAVLTLIPVLLLLNETSTLQWLVSIGLLLALLTMALILVWRILRTVVGGTKWRRAALLLMTILPPMWIIQHLEAAMGLTHG